MDKYIDIFCEQTLKNQNIDIVLKRLKYARLVVKSRM